jgi:hypothetical protein
VKEKMSDEDVKAYWTYIQGLKNYTGTQVCGRRQIKTYFVP